MVREFEEEPTDNLVLVLEPWVPPAAAADWRSRKASPGAEAQPVQPRGGALHLESAISLAATICWEWCRQQGDRFVLAVAGAAPVVVDGITGREHLLLMLECLAIQPGSTEPNGGKLLERLNSVELPPAPILFMSTRPSSLGDDLAERLHRPVATVDVSALREYDFYEGASSHAS